MLDNIKLPSLMYEWAKDRPDKVIDHISPSMLGGCPRAHYFAIKHIPQTTPPNPGALLNFQVGFLWEKIMEEALLKSNLTFSTQMELEDKELNVKGTLDFAIKDNETGEWEVLDCKTESILASGYRRREKKSYLEASERYVIQIGTYMMMMRRQGFKVNRARLIVITKDNGMIEEHYVPYTQELEDKIMARINDLNKHLKNGTIPECECDGWKCQYCNYGDIDTQAKNTKGKVVNTVCCQESLLTKHLQSSKLVI